MDQDIDFKHYVEELTQERNKLSERYKDIQDRLSKRSYTKLMNKLSTKERAKILHCLVEGNSIRSTVRLTGAAKNTVLKLLVETGEACAAYHHEHVINLSCKNLQLDEIWSF